MTKTIAAILLLIAGLTISCSGKQTAEVKEPSVSIHEATFMGNTRAVKDHIAFGTNLNVKDAYGSTPLNIAITFGKTALAKLLIESDADLSVLMADGSTVLHTASFFGRTEVAEAILAKGIDTQVRNIWITMKQAVVIYDQMMDLARYFKIRL